MIAKMTAFAVGDQAAIAPFPGDCVRVFLVLSAPLPLDEVSQGAVHQVFGDGPLIRDELKAAPAHRRIGPVFDLSVIVGQWPLAASRDLPHIRYQQTRMVRFNLVARLGEAPISEGAKQADKSNASSKVHTRVRALHSKPCLEKNKATGVDRAGSILTLYGARNFLAYVRDSLWAKPPLAAARQLNGLRAIGGNWLTQKRLLLLPRQEICNMETVRRGQTG
jgi:hypothetical protein